MLYSWATPPAPSVLLLRNVPNSSLSQLCSHGGSPGELQEGLLWAPAPHLSELLSLPSAHLCPRERPSSQVMTTPVVMTGCQQDPTDPSTSKMLYFFFCMCRCFAFLSQGLRLGLIRGSQGWVYPRGGTGVAGEKAAAPDFAGGE